MTCQRAQQTDLVGEGCFEEVMVAKTLISGGQEVPYFDLNGDYTVYMPCPPPKKKPAIQDLAKNIPSKGKSKCKDLKAAKQLAVFGRQPGRAQWGGGRGAG